MLTIFALLTPSERVYLVVKNYTCSNKVQPNMRSTMRNVYIQSYKKHPESAHGRTNYI